MPASLVSVSDNIDTKPPILTPSDVSFTASTAQLTSTFPPFRSYDVTATVEDMSGNTGSCQFELHFRRKLFNFSEAGFEQHLRRKLVNFSEAGFELHLTPKLEMSALVRPVFEKNCPLN